jgi:Asp-tRNA(Asn)/Glu-tRNA(Gln) amidotransferase A subunit family amidase
MLPALLLLFCAQAPQTPAAPPKPPEVSVEDIQKALRAIGLEFTADQEKLMQKDVSEQLHSYGELQKIPIDNSLPPALIFSPLLPGAAPKLARFNPKAIPIPDAARPANLEDLAYADILTLASLIRARKVSCVELTRMFIARLKRLDPTLHCVVNYTEERALKQAEGLDRELAEGRWRGPLHGIPWGAKDLLAVKGTPTTWGSKIYEHQMIDLDATVVTRLDARGAVLIAKTSLGEFAYGDLWYGGRTRNPWNPEKGSSGSSAGSCAAVAAGCMPFALGTETLGSIVSPSNVCGTTGLRPTFGRVSRYGAMALSWSMDKIGVIARTATDTSIVLAAIQGSDGHDGSVHDSPFAPTAAVDVKGWRVGYLKSAFDAQRDTKTADAEAKPEGSDRARIAHDDSHVLRELEALGVELVPIELPHAIPAGDLLTILTAEAATAFDELTRDGRDAQMVWQAAEAWPNTFRAARLIPAVEYLRANRLRTALMRDMQKLMDTVDVYVAPSFGNASLVITNLTGHPALVAPSGFNADGTPHSITFTGQLYGEAELVALAEAWQRSTEYHLRHPKL